LENFWAKKLGIFELKIFDQFKSNFAARHLKLEMRQERRRHDIWYNDTQHDGVWYTDTQHSYENVIPNIKDIQHSKTHHLVSLG